MARRFRKIKFDGSNVVIQYEEGDNFQNEYSLKCDERPRPEMVKAFDDLCEEVRLLCELPEDYVDRIEVRSVSLNYGGDNETIGATITARMKLEYSNAPLNLNTPNKPEEPYNTDCEYNDETYEKMCLRSECVDKLQHLIDEANLYVDGQRAQGSLFENQEEEKK